MSAHDGDTRRAGLSVSAHLPLNALLDGFPFADEVSRAAAIASLQSAMVRPVLPACPAFAFTATVLGNDKSKFADVSAVLATGHDGAAAHALEVQA